MTRTMDLFVKNYILLELTILRLNFGFFGKIKMSKIIIQAVCCFLQINPLSWSFASSLVSQANPASKFIWRYGLPFGSSFTKLEKVIGAPVIHCSPLFLSASKPPNQ